MAVALVHRPDVVGIFYWGTMLANQLVYLVATNLRDLLFTAFALVNEDVIRKHKAIADSLAAMMVFTVPLCISQSILASPVIQLIGEKWNDAVFVVAAVSVGLVSQPLHTVSAAAFLSCSMFQLNSITSIVAVVLPMGGALAGSWIGDHRAISIGYAIGIWLGNLSALFTAWRALRLSLNALARAVLCPLLFGAIASLLVFSLFPTVATLNPVLSILVVGSLFWATYVLLVRLLDPALYEVSFGRIANHIVILGRHSKAT
jgi:O-antigen/teichoic acid export membrane protein